MSIAEMKQELIKKISELDEDQVVEMYDIVTHHLSDDDWDEPFPLSEIDEAIKEADEGKVTPLNDVLVRLSHKYDLK